MEEDLEQEPETPAAEPEIQAPRLRITPEIRANWLEIANWALIFAAMTSIYFIIYSIDAVGKAEELNGMDIPKDAIITLILFVAVLTFLPVWFYYKFAILLKRGLRNEANRDIESGFNFLRYHYIFYGLMAILYLFFIVLVFIIALIVASRDGFR